MEDGHQIFRVASGQSESREQLPKAPQLPTL